MNAHPDRRHVILERLIRRKELVVDGTRRESLEVSRTRSKRSFLRPCFHIVGLLFLVLAIFFPVMCGEGESRMVREVGAKVMMTNGDDNR